MLDRCPAVCIDASVGAKWFLRDEEGSGSAMALLERFVSGSLRIVVPELFLYEMGSLMSVAARRRRISAAAAVAAVEQLERLSLDLVSAHREMRSALAFSLRLGVSLHDSAYLAAAEAQGVPLVTDDRRLLDATSGRLDWVHSLDGLAGDRQEDGGTSPAGRED